MHGNLDVAQARARQARVDFAARRPPDGSTQWSLQFLLLQAEIFTYQGKAHDVLALLDTPGIVFPDTGELAIKRNMLSGLAHAGLNQPQLSDRELATARRLAESSHSRLIGEVLRTQAIAQLRRDHASESMPLFDQSLVLARAQGDAHLEATDLLNIGFANLELNRFDEAVAWMKEAEAVARPIQARTVLEAALGNIGWAYYGLGDFDQALVQFEQAERAAQAIGTTSAQVDWLQDIGLAQYKLGHWDQARAAEENALATARTLHTDQDRVNIETNLAFLFYARGDFDSARTHAETALHAAGVSGEASAALYPTFLEALLAQRTVPRPRAEKLLLSAQQASAGTPALRWEIENALAHFYQGHDTTAAEMWYRRSIDTFEAQRASVQEEELKLSFFANGDTLYADYAEFLIAAQRPDQALRLLDRGRARTLEEGLGLAPENSPHPGSTDDARALAAREDATILFYSLGTEHSYLWAITAHAERFFVLPKRGDIESRVDRYRKALLKSSDPLHDANADALALYDILVAPADSLIAAGSRVLLIPDGALLGLNFETLLKTSTGTGPGAGVHYWIEDVTLSTIASLWARPVARPDDGDDSSDRLLLIGDPRAADGAFGALPNAAAEITRIRQHFPAQSQTVLTQAEAVPAAYAESQPAQFAYVHFVAHGTASRLSPLDSAVVLSATGHDAENYKLYAREIMRHPLHAKLVTISACYGSGIRAYAGEGLVGLSWAFLRAGSQNVISALWEASDASTPLLMDRLYAELREGHAPDRALRSAKLTLIHSAGVFRKPLYWGPFQLYAGS